MVSIFGSACAFVLSHNAEIASAVIGHATYEGLMKVLDLTSLKERIKRFFSTDKQAEEYLQQICTTQSKNPAKPFRDVEDSFEELTGGEYNKDLYTEMENWIKENEGQIASVSKMDFKNESGFNIGVQNAGKNIFNIGGDYKPKKD